MRDLPIPEPIRESLRKLTAAEGAELVDWLSRALAATEAEAREDERARTLATVAAVRGMMPEPAASLADGRNPERWT